MSNNTQTNSHLSNDLSDLLTVDQTCNQLDVTRQTLAKWVREGRFNKYAIGGRIYFKKSELMNSLKPIPA